MKLSNHYLILHLLLFLLPILSSPAAPSSTKGLEMEEKMRLGSTPPSCHNKCNACHPCYAVQVPTLPSHDRVDPSLVRAGRSAKSDSSSVMDFYDLPGNRYSNYKPLGWKCRCDNHFYNP